MESIGIWYKLAGNDLPKIEFNINLWNLKGNDKKVTPFIDFGIGIKQYKKMDKLVVLIPFIFGEQELFDLYDYVKEPSTARLIFNEMECEVSSHDKYMVIKSSNFINPMLLINVKNQNGMADDITLEQKLSLEMTKFCIDLEKIKKDKKFTQYEDIYIRFRVKSPNIKKIMFCPVVKKNWFLESGFVGTTIVDIKINKERNLPHDICRSMRLDDYKFAAFDKIHLLVMSDSNDDVSMFGNTLYECRKLEEHGWDTYLGNEYNSSNILAYHWKEKSDGNNKIRDFSKLIRISSSTTNKQVILVYMLIVIILGAAGNGIFELIKALFNMC